MYTTKIINICPRRRLPFLVNAPLRSLSSTTTGFMFYDDSVSVRLITSSLSLPQSRNITTLSSPPAFVTLNVARAQASPLFTKNTAFDRFRSVSIHFHKSLLGSLRFKNKGAKMGQHLITLDEMAHRPERELARERRQKKKEKALARKQKNSGSSSSSSPRNNQKTQHDNDDDDQDDDDMDSDVSDDDDDQDDSGDSSLPNPKKVRSKMLQVVHDFEISLKTIRGVEPTVEMFDNVLVNAYDSFVPLHTVAQVVIESPTLAYATCYDPALVKNILQAIQVALELNPSKDDSDPVNEGVIRIPIPRVSLEVRQQTAKTLAKKAEAFRQRIRRLRQKPMDLAKKGMAGRLSVSKDEAARVQQDIEQATEDAIKKLNDIAERKHKSIMSV